jgi:hypothetical protein
MAGRKGRGPGPAPRGRGKRGKPEYEYVGGESDLRYARQAQARLRQQAVRRWVVRLAVLAVIAFAAWMWGPSLVKRARRQAEQTVGGLQKTGSQIREGTERRAGKGVDVDNP